MALIILSSVSYIVNYSLKDILSFDFAKVINVLLAMTIFLLSSFAVLKNGKITSFTPLNLYGLLVFWLLLVGVFSNTPLEILPSFFRFCMYYFLTLVAYQYLMNEGLNQFNKSVKRFTVCLVIVALVFGYYEVFFGSVRFMNGAYRLSGSFKLHPLADSMFLGIVIILWIEYFVVQKKMGFLNFLVLVGLAYLFLNTHSRMPLLFLIISYVTYTLLKLKKIIKIIKVSVGVIILLVSSYSIVVNTEISPRLKKVFVSKNSLRDNSTKTRIEIIENTYNAMSAYEKAVGIGLGGFNNFYRDAKGKDGVAAHNNFLLFFAEGGIIGLTIFLSYQAILFITLFKFIRKKMNYGGSVNYQRLVFVSVFLFEICSFLLNNYYFFTSQSIVFILIGLMMFLMKNNHENKVNLKPL
ncbi:O-antigen ligase family protein [Cellulophaga fucicola]|nr:O-antigen ligase family protein [Cellulophaga fucicola]